MRQSTTIKEIRTKNGCDKNVLIAATHTATETGVRATQQTIQ